MNRYDVNQIIEYINTLSAIPAVLPIEITNPYLSIEIEGGNQVNKEFLLEVIRNFSHFDNLMQSRCQKIYEKECRDVIYYQFEPAWIEISENKVEICYWGTYVNTEFLAVFKKEDDNWVFVSK